MFEGKLRFFNLSLAVTLLLSSFTAAQAGPDAVHGALEVTSDLGRPLYALPDNPAILTARENLRKDPKNTGLALALSKAQAGRRQYREAIETSTKALVFAPGNADLYIERGHRELGLRRFHAAMTDLQRAVSLDPKKLDASYHLGLSHYFIGEFDEAAHSFQNALNLAQNNDSVIDCSNWLYVSLRRAGKEREAALVLSKITPDVKNKEPHLYFYLRLLHFYQGAIAEQAVLPPKPTSPDDIESELSFDTVNYGVGNWNLYHHQPQRAKELFENVVTGQAWNAWGFIGSETDLARLKKSQHPG